MQNLGTRENETNIVKIIHSASCIKMELGQGRYTWSSISAGKWETQIIVLLEIRTIGGIVKLKSYIYFHR